jgi:hypothetical protein
MPRKLVIRARRHGEKEWKEIAAADSNHSAMIERFRSEFLEPKTNEDFAEAELVELRPLYQRSGALSKADAAKAAKAESDRIAKENASFEAARAEKQKKTEKAKAEVFSEAERKAMAEEQKKIDAANAAKAPKAAKPQQKPKEA